MLAIRILVIMRLIYCKITTYYLIDQKSTQNGALQI
jgi:hypothetical protein